MVCCYLLCSKMLSLKSMAQLSRLRGYLDKDFKCVDQFTVSTICPVQAAGYGVVHS